MLPTRLGVRVEAVSPQELLEVLRNASSQDPTAVSASAKRLKEMLDMSGTFNRLQEFAARKDLPVGMRQMAIIQFKNAALSHWRSRKVLSDDDRMMIRRRCFDFLGEEDETIADCNNFIVGKIARQDYPHNWPTLIADLLGVIDSNMTVVYASTNRDPSTMLLLRRALKVLNAVLKEFQNVKMLTGVKTMTTIVEQLHVALVNYYTQISPRFSSDTLNPSTIGNMQVAEDLLIGHLVFKCLVKVATWIFSKKPPVKDEELTPILIWLHQLFQNSAVQLKSLNELRIELVKQLRSSSQLSDRTVQCSVDLLARHIRLFGKFFRRLQQTDRQRFVALPTCADLVLYYWAKVVQATNGPPEFIQDSNDAVYPVRYLVQGLVLFKESLAQWTPVRKNGDVNEQVLSQDFVEGAVKMLVTKFIPLNPSDLENWMADPEEWVNVEDRENDQWEFELRPCGERVLMTLSAQYGQFVTPLLGAIFAEIISQPITDLQSVLQREAVYCAIGRCAFKVKDVIPFNEWVEQGLAPEVQATSPIYPIIKRRIAWLIGKWISGECSNADQPIIWEILTHLLRDRSEGTDAVVRLTAAGALRECIDTLRFDQGVFTPYLPTVVGELVKILGEADTLESKRRVANTLNIVIERAGNLIVPLMDLITQPVPPIWTAAGDDFTLKATLLNTVTELVKATKENSAPLCSLVVPLIKDSMSPGAVVQLDVDALTLWLDALRSSPTIESVNGAPGLIELYPIIMQQLENNADMLGTITSIHAAYFFLNAPAVLQRYGVAIFRSFKAALEGPALQTNKKDMLIALQTIVQLAPSPLWAEPLHASGLFAFCLNAAIDVETDVILAVEHAYLLARMAVSDVQKLVQLMTATASALNTSELPLYEGMLDAWYRNFDAMAEPRNHKLVAMALAALIGTGHSEAVRRLPTEALVIFDDVFCEMKESVLPSDGTASPEMVRHWECSADPPDSYFQGSEDTPEYARRRAAYDTDIVRTEPFNAWVGARLRQAEAVCGPAQIAALMSTAEPELLAKLKKELSA